MFTLLKKAAFVGLGVSERAKEVLNEWAQKGEAHPSPRAERIRNFFESGERVESECCQKMDDLCKRVSKAVRIPSQADMERLEQGLANLAEQVRGFGEASRKPQ